MTILTRETPQPKELASVQVDFRRGWQKSQEDKEDQSGDYACH